MQYILKTQLLLNKAKANCPTGPENAESARQPWCLLLAYTSHSSYPNTNPNANPNHNPNPKLNISCRDWGPEP